MSYPYAPQLPRDGGGVPMQDLPPPKAALQTIVGVPTASSVLTFSSNSTMLEVGAIGGLGAVLRWGSTSVISAAGATGNFAHVIASNTVRRFVIPIESLATQGQSNTASMVGINRREGLYQRVAIKTAGIASVLVTEYGF